MKGIYFILSDTLVFRLLCLPEFMSQYFSALWNLSPQMHGSLLSGLSWTAIGEYFFSFWIMD